jgi:osmotically-inducible protein OsmY
MPRSVFITLSVLIGMLTGWSAAYLNSTPTIDSDALSASIAQQLKVRLAENPVMRANPLDVTVDVDRRLVTIAGLVKSRALHRQALQSIGGGNLQRSYYIEDKIVVRPQREEFTPEQAARQRAAAQAAGEVIGSAVNDAWIYAEISARLRSHPTTASQSALRIDVVGGEVTLRGFVSLPEQKIAAGQLAADTQGVAAIHNQLKPVLEYGKSHPISVG